MNQQQDKKRLEIIKNVENRSESMIKKLLMRKIEKDRKIKDKN